MSLRAPFSLLRSTRHIIVPLSSRRAFSKTPQTMLKEGADRSAEQIEKTKQEQIRKQQKGEGHWHEELASQGESNIAADKEKVHDHDSHMRKLQEETKKKGEKGELN